MRPEEISPGIEKSIGKKANGRRCIATTKRGAPCRMPPLADASFCSVHLPRDEEPEPEATSAGPDTEKLRNELLREVEKLVQQAFQRLQGSGFFSGLNLSELLKTLRESVGKLLPKMQFDVLRMLRDTLKSDYLDLDTWRGLAFVVRSAFEAQIEESRMRLGGEMPNDEFGLDYAFYDTIRPIVSLIYRHWFRVEVTGIENVPADGAAMLVANHSGILPWDGVMLSEAIWENHPQPRHARLLFLKWFATVPFIAPFLSKTGQVLACPENGRKLLEKGNLIGVFPEGVKGIGKLYKDRYQLARFGRGGFIKLALETRATIVPVAIVGAEETYPALMKLDFVAKMLGLPYLPLTPTFPWLGLLGFLPLPTKWHIHFCKPIKFNEKAPSKANDYLMVSMLTDHVRTIVQEAIYELLRRRRSVF